MSPALTLQEALALYFDAGDMTKAHLRDLGTRLGRKVNLKYERAGILRDVRWELTKIIKEARAHEARRTQEQEQAAKALKKRAR